VLHTGGTLGMVDSQRGLVPEPGTLERCMRALPQLCRSTDGEWIELPVVPGQPRVVYALHELSPLLDSAEMGIADWVQIAHEIADRMADYDGFVVVHGTDTMAYTAAALAFMFEGLAKPVVVTGSQVPLAAPRSDALDNLVGALTMAARAQIPQVTLYSNHRLWRGVRARKISTRGFDAFRAGNEGPLAELGVGLRIATDLLGPPPTTAFRLIPMQPCEVAAVRVFPGLSAQSLRHFLAAGLRGLVLESYGAGNVPMHRSGLLQVLAEACARGVVVVNCTQCAEGGVAPSYESGRALAEAGVLSGGDMTPEAALTKLIWVLSRGLTPDQIAHQIATDLRGERNELPAKP